MVVHGRPKPLKIQVLGVTQPPGVVQPLYSRGHNLTRTCNTCPSLIQIGSKTAEKNSAQTNKQTDRQTNKQTNRHYENNGHLAVNQFLSLFVFAKTHGSLSLDRGRPATERSRSVASQVVTVTNYCRVVGLRPAFRSLFGNVIRHLDPGVAIDRIDCTSNE